MVLSLLRLIFFMDHVELQAAGPVVLDRMMSIAALRSGRCTRIRRTHRRSISLLKLARLVGSRGREFLNARHHRC